MNFSRLRSLVEVMLDGDEDKTDLQELLRRHDEFERKVYQLNGALEMARFWLRIASRRITELQQIKQRPQGSYDRGHDPIQQ